MNTAILLLAVLYFWLVSKHWLGFYLIAYFVQLVTFVATFALTESPRYLLETRQVEELKTVLE